MEKRIKIWSIILVIGVLLVGVWLYQTDRLRFSNEKFGIYTLKNNELAVADEDIVWYNASDYRIKLTEKGAEKISALRVGVYGEPFVVKIGDKEIYNGSFWTPISSVPYHGIAIETLVGQGGIIRLEKGYPPGYGDTDPRNDPRIIAYFQKIGKLIQ